MFILSRQPLEEKALSRQDLLLDEFINLAINRFSWSNLPKGLTSERLEEMLKKLKEREEALKAWQKRLEAKEADLEAKEEELEDVEEVIFTDLLTFN